MGKAYNWIYRELVENEDDVVGAIAYSLYKRHKIEYIYQCEQETGAPPTSEQLAEFHRISSSQTSLDHYRYQADMLLSNLLNFATENIASEMQRQQKEVIYNEIQRLLDPIQAEIAKKKNWTQLALDAVVSVIGTIVVIILVGFLLKGYQWIASLNPMFS